MSKRKHRIVNADASLILPSQERGQHDLIERSDKTIPDESGRPSRPYKSVDILTRMERRGSITPSMRQAGEDFRNAFRIAQIDPLAAADMSRPFIDNGTGSSGKDQRRYSSDARNTVWCAILVVGGLGSAGGSCIWHVIGWEMTLKQWALEQGWNGRRVSEDAASGILIATLGTLESYFAREGR